MDDTLRQRLDAILALLSVIVVLLVALIFTVGGARVIALMVLSGFVISIVGYAMYVDHREHPEA